MKKEEKKRLVEDFIGNKKGNEFRSAFEEIAISGEVDTFLKYRMKEDWNKMKVDEAVDLSSVLDHLHHLINISRGSQRRSLVHRTLTVYQKIAAVIILPLLFLSVLYILSDKSVGQSASYTINAPLGSRTAFNLPDGSSGYLNSGSELTVQLPFHSKRTLSLSGEAWFDVVHDPDHPFVVHTKDYRVQVLGTEFNLMAYPYEEVIELVLESGMLAFEGPSISEAIIMKPDQKLSFDGRDIILEKTDTEKYTAWKEGKLIFKGEQMTELAKKLERWYNVEVLIRSEELFDYAFVGTFEDDSLEEVLTLLSMTSPIEFSIEERRMLEDGSWTRKKVILTKRK